MTDLKTLIREVPDFPKPGILFYDITTLLKNAAGLKQVIDDFYRHYKNKQIDLVVGIEARGYFFAPALALALGTGFAPVRKPKKLPCEVEFWEYELEYGTDRIEIHKDAVTPGQNVLIVDDVLATGGTAAASGRLVEKLGGRIAGLGFVIELDFLHGRQKLPHYDILSLIHY
ncbi:MAG TPA: adenine phosphoribosyltransferase [Bryobacteraceae bacterium]|nr:adenine phosphoribosyltransferase [Bryobacteraceae bacterium]